MDGSLTIHRIIQKDLIRSIFLYFAMDESNEFTRDG